MKQFTYSSVLLGFVQTSRQCTSWNVLNVGFWGYSIVLFLK